MEYHQWNNSGQTKFFLSYIYLNQPIDIKSSHHFLFLLFLNKNQLFNLKVSIDYRDPCIKLIGIFTTYSFKEISHKFEQKHQYNKIKALQ